MTDVLFTHSYFLRLDPKEYRAMAPYPPLGALFAAAAVRAVGYRVALFDSMLAESAAEFETHIRRHSPEFVVIYDDDFNYLTKMCLSRMRHAAFQMTACARAHGCTVIVHSSDATDNLDQYFDHGVDYILVGEAENTLRELLDVLSRRISLSPIEVPGVVRRNKMGVIERAPQREALRDLDALPMPARDLIDFDNYRAAWRNKHGYFSMNMVTTRGCPFHCNWCAKPLYGQVYNCHSPRRIAEEMLIIKRHWQPDHIWFCDDIFGLRPGWLEEFADEVERLDARIPFKCLSRADLLLRDDAVQSLKRAGCQSVWIGAESGSQKILDAMDKGITVDQIHRSAEELRAAGIRVGFFLQFGYPGEEGDEIDATLRMVRDAVPDEVGISVSYPLPGTKFYDRVKAQMGPKQHWSESADLAMMFRGAYRTEFYRALAAYVHKDHRLRLAMRAVRAILRDGRIPDRGDLRRLALIPYYLMAGGAHFGAMKLLQRRRTEQTSTPL